MCHVFSSACLSWQVAPNNSTQVNCYVHLLHRVLQLVLQLKNMSFAQNPMEFNLWLHPDNQD